MSRRVQLVFLCEDKQQRAFLSRFFGKMGWPKALWTRGGWESGGSAGQFVRKRFVEELRVHRTKHVARVLVVMVDGDAEGVRRRMKHLDEACRDESISPRKADEGIAVFVPTWNIETWLAWLGGETVDESRPDYPRLPKASQCDTQVAALVDMCRSRELRQSAPGSLVAACQEYRRLEENSRD